VISSDTHARAEQLLGFDAYTRQLNDVIPGWLHPNNLVCFQHAISGLAADAPILEIGSFSGLSTCVLSYMERKAGKTNPFFTCDPWGKLESLSDAPLTNRTALSERNLREFVRESFIRNVRFFSPTELPASLEMTADDFFAAWNRHETETDIFGRAHQLGGLFSFVYVDGNHSYRFVKNDFENLDAVLMPGGMVLFDDSAEGSESGPARVAEQVERLPHYELIRRAPNAFFRKRGMA
jgi:hypothetical protein